MKCITVIFTTFLGEVLSGFHNNQLDAAHCNVVLSVVSRTFVSLYKLEIQQRFIEFIVS